MTVDVHQGSALNSYFAGNGRVYEICTRRSVSWRMTFTIDAGLIDVSEVSLNVREKWIENK